MIQKILRRTGVEKYISSKYLSAWLVLLIDTFVSSLTTLMAYLLVSGLFSSPVFSPTYGLLLTLAAALFSAGAFLAFRTFRSVIRHSTLREIWKLGAATGIKECFMFLYVLTVPFGYPSARIIAIGLLLDLLLTLFLLIALRLVMIVVYDMIKLKSAHRDSCKRVLVYGTDDKSISVTIRLQNSPHYKIIGFLTYGSEMKRYMIADHPVYYFEKKREHSVSGRAVRRGCRALRHPGRRAGRARTAHQVLHRSGRQGVDRSLYRRGGRRQADEPARPRDPDRRFARTSRDQNLAPGNMRQLLRQDRSRNGSGRVDRVGVVPPAGDVVNVAGTRNVADFCLRYGVEKMIMISTDKAVNPTNIMGASKRLAEIYVQSLGQAIAAGKIAGHTKYITTRFGNVLGSNGSVIPRFREQIAKGGPVTVTHPDITRFFMTIPEACRLVMEAATLSSGNEIFAFDMGESVKIADLARRMIELAGFRVGEEIEIVYTGLRPGEKLYEEVLSNKENTKPTSHEKIHIACVREYDYEAACAAASQLEELSRTVDIPRTVLLMKKIVPEFKSRNS